MKTKTEIKLWVGTSILSLWLCIALWEGYGIRARLITAGIYLTLIMCFIGSLFIQKVSE